MHVLVNQAMGEAREGKRVTMRMHDAHVRQYDQFLLTILGCLVIHSMFERAMMFG
jgi:hypothetical protein